MNRASNVYIVGSGIASLAAAVYLIRYKIVPPGRVTIFESEKDYGGAMGASMVDVPFEAYPVVSGLSRCSSSVRTADLRGLSRWMMSQ